MSTVLYLSGQNVQAVIGTSGAKKIAVQNVYSSQAPEGSIINGMIMDTVLFTDFIKDFWKENKLPTKDVTVVINTTKFIAKTIDMPVLSAAKTKAFIEREFADIKKADDELYGYIPLGFVSKKVKKIYAESIPREFIKEYIDIFKEAGVELKAIHSGEGSLISLTEMTVAPKHKNFIMLVADAVSLTTLLWVEGSFYYFNSVRCFHEQDTPDYAQDIARSVSQILQFMKTRELEVLPEIVELSGIPDANISMYRETLISNGINIPLEIFDSTQLSADKAHIQRYLQAASGLVINGKDQNYLVQYAAKKTKEKGKSNTGLILIVAAFVIMLTGTIIANVIKNNKQKKLDELIEENNSPLVKMQLDEYDTALEDFDFLANQKAAIVDVDENIQTYPICDRKVIKKIYDFALGHAEITFESFSADSGLVTVKATAENVEEINKFIKNLNTDPLFSNVTYTGYTYNSANGMYNIHVSCALAESAGRKEK